MSGITGSLAESRENIRPAAVAFRGSGLLVKAVPCSGKTRVIVARDSSLHVEGVAPAAILLPTLSRRAVGELRDRLAIALEAAELPETRAFHSIAARLLADADDSGHSRRLLSKLSGRTLDVETKRLRRNDS